MSHSKKELADYRFKQAEGAIATAILLINAEDWNAAIGRLYYACFYAVSAYLILNDINAHTHSGTKTQFNKELIKTGKMSGEFGTLFNKLLEDRQEADYEFFTTFKGEDVTPLLPQTQAFVQAISELINKTE